MASLDRIFLPDLFVFWEKSLVGVSSVENFWQPFCWLMSNVQVGYGAWAKQAIGRLKVALFWTHHDCHDLSTNYNMATIKLFTDTLPFPWKTTHEHHCWNVCADVSTRVKAGVTHHKSPKYILQVVVDCLFQTPEYIGAPRAASFPDLVHITLVKQIWERGLMWGFQWHNWSFVLLRTACCVFILCQQQRGLASELSGECILNDLKLWCGEKLSGFGGGFRACFVSTGKSCATDRTVNSFGTSIHLLNWHRKRSVLPCTCP